LEIKKYSLIPIIILKIIACLDFILKNYLGSQVKDIKVNFRFLEKKTSLTFFID